MDKDRNILLYGFVAYPCGSHDIHILLPVQGIIAIPKGTNYAYLGSLTYRFSNDSFDIDSIHLGDGFDSAKKYVKGQNGDAAAGALIRVSLKPRYSKDDDEGEG
jgi:hypothetical protein